MADADIVSGGLMMVALTGRLSNASRMAVGHFSGTTSQARRRSAMGSDAGAAYERARSKE
jgi:hypothetical protein